MDSQIIAVIGLFGFIALGFWLMFGRPGNKKPSGNDPGDYHTDGRINPDQQEP